MSKSLLRSTSTVSMMTFISRILGFVRDIVAAQVFGINASVDAFYLAFRIPNLLRNLFAEGAFSQAFVPVLSDYRHRNNEDELRQFISRMSGALGLALLIITIIGVLCAPLIIKLFSPGLEPFRYHLASYMLRITFPYAFFICLTAFAGSVLNSYGRFGVAAFNPALLNVALIATAFGVTHYFKYPVEAQAWGVLIGGVIQLLVMLPFLHNIGFLTLPSINWQDEGVRRVLKLMLPALLGASVQQLNILFNTIFASFLPVGSIGWLYYSERLAYFPLGVFGVALATVIMPHLSRQHAAQSKEAFAQTMDWGIRCNLLLGIPAVITMALLAGPLIATLFHHGQFTNYDVMMTRKSTLAYAVGLQAFMLAKVLSSGFYAQKSISTAVRITIIALIANVIFSAILIHPLAHAGLALASSLSAWLNVILLTVVLHKRNIYRFQSGWGMFLMRLGIANLMLSLLLWQGSANISYWLTWHWYEKFSHLFGLLFLGMLIYLGSLWVTGMRLHHLKVQGVNL